MGCQGYGVRIRARRQGRQRYALALMCDSHCQALLIGTGEQLSFAALTTMPDRSHRVNDIARWQLASARNHRVPCRATLGIFLPRLGHNTGATSAMDRPIHTAPTGQAAAGGVDNGICWLACALPR